MRDLFTKDLGWKLFSLFLAAAIWFTVKRVLQESAVPVPDANISTVTYDNLPVMVVSATADVRGFRVVPTTIKVTVIGPAAAMKTLQASELHATVNATGASLVQSVILPVEISSPSKVAVASIEPDRIILTPPAQPEKKP